MNPITYLKDDANPYAKYDAVTFLPSKPRSTKDFTDLQQILRFKLNALIRDLFGNCRIMSSIKETTENGQTYIQLSGLWYIDGYRVLFNDLRSDINVNRASEYKVYLGLELKEITAAEDPSIALQDADNNILIETSRRAKLTYTLRLCNPDQSLTFDPPIPNYVLGTIYYDSQTQSWKLRDSDIFKFVELKYSDAIDIARKAVHKENDEKTVVLERITSVRDEDFEDQNARIVVQKISDTHLSFGFETMVNGEPRYVAAFEVLKEGGDWHPIIWLRPGILEYPISYLTEDGITFQDNKGYVTDITQYHISISNKANKFILDPTELYYGFKSNDGDKVALWVKNAMKDWDLKRATMFGTEGNDPGIADSGYTNPYKIYTTNSASKQAVVKFDLGSDEQIRPKDGVVKVQHKLVYNSLQTCDAIITAKVETSDNDSSYSTIFVEKWLLKDGIATYTVPFEFSISDSQGYVPRYIKLTYSIYPTRILNNNERVEATVSFRDSNACTWETFSVAYPTTEMQYMVMNKHILWVDNDGNVRIKKVSNTLPNVLGDAIDKMISSEGTAGDVNAPGGKIIGALDLSRATVEVSQEITRAAFTQDTLKLPVVKGTEVDKVGLISSATIQNIISQINSLKPELGAIKDVTPTNVYYVAKNWNIQAANPYFTSLSSAVNQIITDGTSSALIIVYPGVYDDDINFGSISRSISVGIYALEPRNTFLNGSLILAAQGSNIIDLYTNISFILQSGKNIHVNGCKLFIDRSSLITSSADTTVIKVEGTNSIIELHGQIWVDRSGLTSDDVNPVINVYSGGSLYTYGKIEVVNNVAPIFNIDTATINVYGPVIRSGTKNCNQVIHSKGSQTISSAINLYGPMRLIHAGIINAESKSQIFIKNNIDGCFPAGPSTSPLIIIDGSTEVFMYSSDIYYWYDGLNITNPDIPSILVSIKEQSVGESNRLIMINSSIIVDQMSNNGTIIFVSNDYQLEMYNSSLYLRNVTSAVSDKSSIKSSGSIQNPFKIRTYGSYTNLGTVYVTTDITVYNYLS